MKKNSGRKERRRNQFQMAKKKGDLNRLSTHKMRSEMGQEKEDKNFLQKLFG